MLGKIFKQEMKSTSKLFLPMILGFVVITLLCKLAFENSYFSFLNSRFASIISTIFYILYFIYIIALTVMTSVFIVIHFYKTMISDQGYLTHTLPVKTSTIINGKLLCAIFWEVATFLLLILSVFVFTLGHIHISVQDIRSFFNLMMEAFRQLQYDRLWVLAIEIFVTAIASLFSGPLMLYASMALGHLFQKHRVLWSIAAYFGIYIAMQVISSFFLASISTPSIQNAYDHSAYMKYFISNFMAFCTVFSLVCTAGFYAITDYIFSRHLNLE